MYDIIGLVDGIEVMKQSDGKEQHRPSRLYGSVANLLWTVMDDKQKGLEADGNLITK